MFKLNALLAVLFIALSAGAKDYPIHSAADLVPLVLKPGDRAVMQPGDWSNQQIIFKGIGTKQAPITLVAAEPGKIILKGNSNLLIDGQYLVVDGLNFTQGYSYRKDVVTFSKDSQGCRLTNTAIVDFNTPEKKQDNKWVMIYGDHNRVDHCYLKGKTNQGPTLIAWVAEKPNNDQIDHNFFDERADLGPNGGETLRIGSRLSATNDSFTTVEDNVFYHCNGDLQTISNKASHTTIRNNLMFECAGTITLQGGNYAEVFGNYFIGNNIKETGGVRIVGENHKVYQNYFYALTGKEGRSVITMLNSRFHPATEEYIELKNLQVKNNTILNCAMAVQVGSAKHPEKDVAPQNVCFANNLVLNTEPMLTAELPAGIKSSGNILFGIKLSSDLPDGFDMKDPKLEVNSLGIHQSFNNIKAGAPQISNGQKQLFNGVGIGPAWFKGLPQTKVK